MLKVRVLVPAFVFLCAVLLFTGMCLAQETTGGLQGTVKDPSGAVVPNAKVVVTATSLVGNKETTTDSSGYFRFANLPPGNLTLTVTSSGFSTFKQEMVLEVGHLPTVDVSLEVGKAETIVEVSGQAPQIDVTTNVSTTNVTEDVINNIPHGRSFQSVIQFAPSARNEPLMGNSSAGGYPGNGSGGSSPGSTANGGDHGFSVAGGSDSENSYLVEGQETANLIGGYSRTSVPFDFIQEVEIKNSGIQAEHGGALGGVVNVVMKKGANSYHGSLFSYFENDAMDAHPSTFYRYDPNSVQLNPSWGLTDVANQLYVPKKDKTSDVFPGFTFGGPILKNRLFFFVGFNPEFNDDERKIIYPTNSTILPGGGPVAFSQNTQTYYTSARIDFAVTQKLRVYASWLYQLQKQSGENLPTADPSNLPLLSPINGQPNNVAVTSPLGVFAHSLGYTSPNSTTNVGADYSITPRLILTGRYGYYFENYHDFGFPSTGALTNFVSNGIGATDTSGNPLPAAYQQTGGYQNVANSSNFTTHNADKASQVDVSLAWYKSGWRGTHNFKFGYQLNHLSNAISQHYNVPRVDFYVGSTSVYSPQGPTGAANCAALEAADASTSCQGKYGYISVYDYGSGGQVTSNNNAFFFQDSWSIAKGLTINGGLRIEKENLPAENQPNGGISNPISFGWGDKIAPRIGVAWDPLGNGKMKVFGGYGQFYDQMKLNLAISSFGGQFWQQCYYGLDTSNIASIVPEFNSAGRYCVGPNGASQANWAGGTTPAGLTFLENQNFRTFPNTCSTCTATEEGVAPGLKPYKQHEYTAGFDYQIAPTVAFEARYDRRRLDHVIEDSSIFNPSIGETFVIVNPGQGVNTTFSGFYNFIAGLKPTDPGAANCAPPACPNILKPERNYDGVEFRLTKSPTKHWSGMFSYTYSRLWGNYTGLTSSDQADGGGGRNAPNNGRSFDEPFFSWNANGQSSSGLLPTDRPNTFKGYVYYELGWLHRFTTDFGIFQVMYQGSPLTSYLDAGYAFATGYNVPNAGGAFPVDIVNRGKWIDVHQDPTTGVITASAPYTKRTPWYNQTDFNVSQNYKLSETKSLRFTATIANLLNERAVTQLNGNIDSGFSQNFIAPGGQTLFSGIPFYQAAFHPYNYTALLNAAPSSVNCGTTTNPTGVCGPATINSGYGVPNRYQAGRTMRLGLFFTF